MDILKELFYNDQVAVFVDGKIEVLNIPLKQRLYVIEDIDAMHSIVLKRSPEQLQKEQEHKLKVEAELELLKQTQGEMMARSMMKGKEDTNEYHHCSLGKARTSDESGSSRSKFTAVCSCHPG